MGDGGEALPNYQIYQISKGKKQKRSWTGLTRFTGLKAGKQGDYFASAFPKVPFIWEFGDFVRDSSRRGGVTKLPDLPNFQREEGGVGRD
jgi:hypothetical protein